MQAATTIWAAVGALVLAGGVRAAEERVDYLRQIKPLLSERCGACHGALKQAGGLRLDTAALARQGGASGPAVKPGDAAASLLLQRVTSGDDAERMPQEGAPLTAEQIALLRQWIAENAEGPADEQPEADPRAHWAFRPVTRPAVPQFSDWARNPIDAFLGAALAREGLTPQAEAARLTLVRRLYFDLVGLPPEPEDLARIVADPRADWYERLVDQLLNDPRHGERWARHWMDVWRYSDWWGLGDQLRNSQHHIWHYRDWIVESLNADVPYDEMVRLMLAADELRPSDLNQLRATGYLARNYFLFNRNQWLEETVEHVGKGFLGLTLNCTKCHDHKYDPIPQVDFYRMRAFFEPYHVRLDMVPGEADLARDGIPRVFDGVLDAPTYRFLRGQESQPDKSAAIAPGVPELLAFRELKIEPVTLPADAWQPERRPGIVEAHLAAARQRTAAAQAAVVASQKKLAQAQQRAAEALAARSAAPEAKPTTSEAPTIVEKFATLDAQRWRTYGGEWSHQPGRLEQKRDGATRSALRLLSAAPRDFDATLRFTILGGSQWRSVGLTFDATQADPTGTAAADDTELLVYVSAVSGGSKVQAAFGRAGAWQYPADALQARPIALNREYTLRVQARDRLINAWLDGELAVAWRAPLARRDGALQLVTFDALTAFHEVTIAPLKADVLLREPGASPGSAPASPETAVAEAQAEVAAAEAARAVAEAELESVAARAAALRAQWANAPDAPVAAAVAAERRVAVAQARQTIANVELRLVRAVGDKQPPIEKELAAAREALAKAEAQAAAPVGPNETFAPLIGAKWTPTRFLSSGADDPTVTFAPQSSGRRKALAEWITDPRNPLTARVAVNHLWARHLGTPLVATVFDFGRKGSPPTQPELLDWLAAELVESGWSMKHLHRLIAMSAAYRLSSSSAGREAVAARDPDNRHGWRRSALRLESQAVRDAILALAGSLDLTQGGPPVPPAQQTESPRRSLYFFHSNNDRNLFLTTFDEAAVKECYRRDQSIVPQQALALTNSRLVHDASARIAARLSQGNAVEAAPADDAAFVRRAFAVLLGMDASAAETAACLRALEAWRKLPETQGGDVARAHLIWALLNHNDFVTLR